MCNVYVYVYVCVYMCVYIYICMYVCTFLLYVIMYVWPHAAGASHDSTLGTCLNPCPAAIIITRNNKLTRCYSNAKKIKIDAVQPKSSRAYVKQKSTLVGGQ